MLLTHMKDLAVRHICPAQSNGGEGKKLPRFAVASNCYHPKDKGFPRSVRIVSGRLQNVLTRKR